MHQQRLSHNTQLIWRLVVSRCGWLLRIAAILVAIGWLRPPEPRALLGPPQTVETVHPHVCVHTRLIDEVETWKIQESLRLVREMGADHIVEFFPWAYAEHTPGTYDWASFDRIMLHAENQGIRVIARMGFVPSWAQESVQNPTLNTLPREAYDDFAAFVAAFAERYAGTANEIIIWNEPNLAFEWGYEAVDPEGYVDLLEAVYDVTHAANPNVVILAAGLAPTLEPEGSASGLDDILFLRAMYAAGGGEYFDGVAMHTYGFTMPAARSPAPDVLNFRRAELLYQVMQTYGDAHKPVYITETGWNDDPRWALAVAPSQRAIQTIEALKIAASWEWLDQLCIWMLRTPVPVNGHQDGYTMITSAFQPRAIYYAVQSYARGFEQEEQLWLPRPTD